MKLFDYTVEVTTGLEAAFNVVADPRSKLLWAPGIRRVEVNFDVPHGPGMGYLASSGIWPLEFVFQEQTVDWIENERVTYVGRSPWGHFKTCVVLESEQGGTRLHYRMDYAFPAGWLGALVGHAIAWVIRQPMEARAVRRLKEVVEQRLWQPEGKYRSLQNL